MSIHIQFHCLDLGMGCAQSELFYNYFILQVEGIKVHANEGGVTQTRGGIYCCILPAGCNTLFLQRTSLSFPAILCNISTQDPCFANL